MIAALLWLVCACAHAREIGRLTSSDGLTLVFRAAPVANLTYQLDCLSGVTPCTRKPYEDLWKNGDWTSEDDAALQRWSALMSRVRQNVVFDDASPRGALPQWPSDLDLQQRVRIAALRAETWDEYASGLQLLLRPEDAKGFLDVTRHFFPRFEPWWRRRGRPQAESSAADLFALARRKDLPDYFGKIARFYGDQDLRDQTVEFDFVTLPSSDAHHDSAEQLENYAVIEAVPGETPEGRIDVVAHELFHYFFAQGWSTRGAAVVDGFAASTRAYAFAAYGLMNESLAAALGNGLVSRLVTAPDDFQRRLGMENSLYADPLIDGAAKALIPAADRWLADGTRLGDPEFVSGYLDAVGGGLGAKMMSPSAWFRSAELVFGPGHEKASDAFINALAATSAWTYGLDDKAARAWLDDYPGTSVALFLRAGDASRLRPWAPELGARLVSQVQRLARRKTTFVYGAFRGPKAYVCVFVAPDDAARDAAVADFARRPALFQGLMP